MRQIEVVRRARELGAYDVVVCGAGPAGWVAAVSAARAGKRVALIERLGFLGGTATAGVVVPVSGFYFQGRRVVGGIAWEFVQALEKLGAAQVELPKGHVSVNLEYYKLLAQRMALESGVELMTNTLLTDCVIDGDRVTHAVVENKSGALAVPGACFIDATGDGDLCRLAGVPMLTPAQEVQPLSLCFILDHVDTTTPLLRDCIHHDGKNGSHSVNDEIHAYLAGLAEQGQAPQFCGPWFNTLLKTDSVAVNITRAAVDATDAAAYVRAESQLRENMFRLVALLRARYPEFQRCEIVASACNAGIRETRHIRGLHTVTAEDFSSGRTYACPVAHPAHPMDIHLNDGSGQVLIPLERDCYIPHLSLISAEVSNVIAAGRCLSAESAPYASLRVQATMMSTGEAAGVMAALCCESGAPLRRLDEGALAARFAERGFVL